MSVFVIKGTGSKEAQNFIAQALRNSQLTQKKGPVLILDDSFAHPLRLVEKLLSKPIPVEGVELPGKRSLVNLEDAPSGTKWDLTALKFKEGEPLLIIVGDRAEDTLKRIEAHIPGFTDKMGKRTTILTEGDKS